MKIEIDDKELIDTIVEKVGMKMLTPDEIKQLLDHVTPKYKAFFPALLKEVNTEQAMKLDNTLNFTEHLGNSSDPVRRS